MKMRYSPVLKRIVIVAGLMAGFTRCQRVRPKQGNRIQAGDALQRGVCRGQYALRCRPARTG